MVTAKCLQPFTFFDPSLWISSTFVMFCHMLAWKYDIISIIPENKLNILLNIWLITTTTYLSSIINAHYWKLSEHLSNFLKDKSFRIIINKLKVCLLNSIPIKDILYQLSFMKDKITWKHLTIKILIAFNSNYVWQRSKHST